ncbi:MAG: magnesium/cobalt transporter CorA [Phycisphaerales bacterium]
MAMRIKIPKKVIPRPHIRRRKPPVGARPGTLVLSDDMVKPKLHVYRYDQETVEEFHPETATGLDDYLEEGKVVWIDVQGLGDEATLKSIAEQFEIHPLALEDVVNIPSRPKSEPYDEQLLVITRMFQKKNTIDLDVEQVSIIIGPDYVLTFQERYGDVLDPVRKRIRTPGGLMRKNGPDYLGYAILDTIIDAYYPLLTTLGDYLEDFESEVLESATTETLRRLNQVKNTLIVIRRAVSPQRDAVNSLIRDPNPLISDNVRIYLRDTHDHCVQMNELVESYRELVSGLMNTYLSVVSNRMNEVMKVLTIMASIFVPLTFLAGIYGMNFEYMPELHSRWAYPILLIVMAVVGVGMLGFFYLKGWIGEPPRRRSDDGGPNKSG